MSTPKLSELPQSPRDNRGWPWTAKSLRPVRTASNGSSWPRISIVTPSYNHAEFLEETIRSVLFQGYPNLEYIIVDGGSTDGTIEIIQKYDKWITYWVSENDSGQSEAINKGFTQATGEIFAWLNSDDLYIPNCLFKVATAFTERRCDIISGNSIDLESGVEGTRRQPSIISVGEMLRSYQAAVSQPSTFWKRKCWDLYGPLDIDLHYRMDYALFLCFAASELVWVRLNADLAYFRRHEKQKTWTWSSAEFHFEKKRAIRRFAQHRDFAQLYSRDIERGLHFEGWLISWMAINRVMCDGGSSVLKMLIAPAHNPRCLLLPAYYRTLLSTVLRRVKGLLKARF